MPALQTLISRPPRDEKREAILRIAYQAFLTDGYAATSMSEIARQVGGSKATLYNYFCSKEELFTAVVDEKCQVIEDMVFDAALALDDFPQSADPAWRPLSPGRVARGQHRDLPADHCGSRALSRTWRAFYSSVPATQQRGSRRFFPPARSRIVIWKRMIRSRWPAASSSCAKASCISANCGTRRPSRPKRKSANVAEAVDVFLTSLRPRALTTSSAPPARRCCPHRPPPAAPRLSPPSRRRAVHRQRQSLCLGGSR